MFLDSYLCFFIWKFPEKFLSFSYKTCHKFSDGFCFIVWVWKTDLNETQWKLVVSKVKLINTFKQWATKEWFKTLKL